MRPDSVPPQSSRRLLPWKLPTTRPCTIIASLQIAFLVTFFSLYLLFFSNTGLHNPSSPAAASARLRALCPGLLLREEAAELDKLPLLRRNVSLPENNLSKLLQRPNGLPPRNRDLFPDLPTDHLVLVLYVHNRPSYMRLAVEGLSRVEGISEALLIVSHDGLFEEMNAVADSIRFCQVKQIFAPFSPHIFSDAFPGISPGDCRDKEDARHCKGNADQYGNHRAPHIVSLKHHWWWMMNTIWDGLRETRDYHGHILFIEEDHYLFPNAYRNIQTLSVIKACKCPSCYMANLAPADVAFKGERTQSLIAGKIGNFDYAFNRTIWRKIHASAEQFCNFDDYNWDITMWSTVYPKWGDSIYTLRGPRPSAQHFGKCGLHQGRKNGQPTCFDEGRQLPPVEKEDMVPNINPDWAVNHKIIEGYNRGFKGWGGWGDTRDQSLCLDFASVYHSGITV